MILQLTNSGLLPNFKWVALSGPLITVFLSYILVNQYYGLEGLIRRCRIVAAQINHKFDNRPILSQFSPTAGVGNFFSVRHGNAGFRILMGALISLCFGLYLLVNILSTFFVYNENHLAGFIISILLFLATFILIYSFSSVIIDLPKHYDQIYQEVLRTGELQKVASQNDNGVEPFQTGLKSLYGILIPRNNLIEKGVFFWYGFIGALAITGIQQSQVDLINSFFSQGKDYTIKTVPAWSIFALGLVYFFIEELLLQQAKYLWNDIRDKVRDSKSPDHQDRGYTQGLLSNRSAIRHVVLRWTLGLVLGYMLGGWQMFALFIFISLHQAVYVLWGKPRGDKHPIILLMIISFNIAPQFIAGAMAVSGISWVDISTLILLVILYFFSFGFMAAYWKMDAVHIETMKNKGSDILDRPQSPFFRKNGNAYQHYGFLIAIISSLLLLCRSLLADQIRYLISLDIWLGSIISGFSHIDLKNVPLLGILSLIIIILIITTILFKLLGLSASHISPIVIKIKIFMMAVSYLVFFLGLVFTVLEKNPLVYFVAILFMNIGAIFMYEGMQWDEFTGKEMKRQIPTFN